MNAELLRALAAQVEQVHLPSQFTTWWRIFSFDPKTGVVKKIVAQQALDIDALKELLGKGL